ncbi:hypothetical protein BJV74DRAFT_163591 [Russula compacta]|nr:hypothetical protein BJV74DRAFT_163591 [Russula compacta]
MTGTTNLIPVYKPHYSVILEMIHWNWDHWKVRSTMMTHIHVLHTRGRWGHSHKLRNSVNTPKRMKVKVKETQGSQPRLAHLLAVLYMASTPQMIPALRKRMLRVNTLNLRFQQTTLALATTRWPRHASPARFPLPLFPPPQLWAWAPISLLPWHGFLPHPQSRGERLYPRLPAPFQFPRRMAPHWSMALLPNVRRQRRGRPFFHRPVNTDPCSRHGRRGIATASTVDKENVTPTTHPRCTVPVYPEGRVARSSSTPLQFQLSRTRILGARPSQGGASSSR